MPPAALISSTASFAPCTCSRPASACGPVTSSTRPNTIGSAANAGDRIDAASEQAATNLTIAVFICCSSVRFYGPAFGRLYFAPIPAIRNLQNLKFSSRRHEDHEETRRKAGATGLAVPNLRILHLGVGMATNIPKPLPK